MKSSRKMVSSNKWYQYIRKCCWLPYPLPEISIRRGDMCVSAFALRLPGLYSLSVAWIILWRSCNIEFAPLPSSFRGHGAQRISHSWNSFFVETRCGRNESKIEGIQIEEIQIEDRHRHGHLHVTTPIASCHWSNRRHQPIKCHHTCDASWDI